MSTLLPDNYGKAVEWGVLRECREKQTGMSYVTWVMLWGEEWNHGSSHVGEYKSFKQQSHNIRDKNKIWHPH